MKFYFFEDIDSWWKKTIEMSFENLKKACTIVGLTFKPKSSCSRLGLSLSPIRAGAKLTIFITVFSVKNPSHLKFTIPK